MQQKLILCITFEVQWFLKRAFCSKSDAEGRFSVSLLIIVAMISFSFRLYPTGNGGTCNYDQKYKVYRNMLFYAIKNVSRN